MAQMALRQLNNDPDTAVAVVAGVLLGVIDTCGRPQPEVRVRTIDIRGE